MNETVNPVTGSDIIENIGTMMQGGATGNSLLDTVVFGEVTIGNLIAVAIIIIAAIVLKRIISSVIRRVLSGKVDAKNSDGLVKLASWTIYFIAFLVICPQLHIDISGLLVAGGVVGVAIGFASQSTLSNLVAGILLMIERPISVGDVVIINDTEGYVESISLLSTHIKTYDGIILRIPNEKVFSSDIRNCVSSVARRFRYDVDISYSDDADTAVKIIRETISRHPYALVEPAPSIYVEELGAHGIRVVVKIWAPSEYKYWWSAKSELLWQIFKDLCKAGVDIPFNQLTIWYGKENAEKLLENIDSDKSAEEIIGKKPEPKGEVK
ncbi:MAG TPA: mechanosensitive ion channel family protein [Methanocorpusculum sp.]|nr:mechanosensitive ion channel family protein [Methanocorpusculum sp.]